MQKRKKPKFHRQHSHAKKKVNSNSWRKPKGIYSAQALGLKSRGKTPQPGYGQPKKIRGKHPSGFAEVLVKNSSQLQEIDVKTQAIRLSSTLGLKKKLQIIKEAEAKKIKILNKPVKKPKKKAAKEKKKSGLKKIAEKTEPTPEEKKAAEKTEKGKGGVAELAEETTPTPEEKKTTKEALKEVAKSETKEKSEKIKKE